MTPVHYARIGVAALGAIVGCSSGEPADPDRSPATVASVPARPAEKVSDGEREPETIAARLVPQGSQTPDRVFRPDDLRPQHDDAALARIGIHRYASRRLILYSDAPAERIAPLPPLVDALYDEWTAYFGELPAARDGAEYQLTGYLIGDLDLFRSAGLVPDEITFQHGRHRGQEFWMRDQEYDYYRTHLLLHEATHCFMTCLPGSGDAPPWYLEGMAERFGTHRVADGHATFRIMPISPEETAGFGRITLVREEIAAGRFKSLDGVFAIRPEAFLDDASYAWSWAACTFLDSHPRYRDRFLEMGDPRLRRRLMEEFEARFAADREHLSVEWAHFAQTLRYGHDVERATIVFELGKDLANGLTATTQIAADHGWQSSGVRVEAGERYVVTAEGRFTLADDPKPWVSDAGGITFDYFDGRPLGRLTAAILAEAGEMSGDPARGLLNPIDIGRESEVVPDVAGTLYFRVNDGWDRLADNRGEVTVTIRRSEGP